MFKIYNNSLPLRYYISVMESFYKIFRYSFLLLIFLLLTPQCKKDKQDEIPYVYVNFYINTTSTQYLGLNNIGGYVYVTGGVRGILIYRRSTDEFMAYERNCPYQPSNTDANVEVDQSAVIAVDSSCGSQFLLLDGSIVQGPATIFLKQYHTSFDGTTLHVFN
jgi:nitrite reductase/ring-hydroxylating ferredoxin subunit